LLDQEPYTGAPYVTEYSALLAFIWVGALSCRPWLSSCGGRIRRGRLVRITICSTWPRKRGTIWATTTPALGSFCKDTGVRTRFSLNSESSSCNDTKLQTERGPGSFRIGRGLVKIQKALSNQAFQWCLCSIRRNYSVHCINACQIREPLLSGILGKRSWHANPLCSC
jgi:hypothetical protein